MDDWNFDDCRASSAKLLRELNLMLPNRSSAATLAQRSKLPFKVDVLGGTLAWRLHELSSAALISYDRQMHVAGIITARAAMETAAALDALRHLIESYDGIDADALDQRLMTGIFGSRNRKDRPPSVNILGVIDRVTKRFPAFRTIYDELSEYAHPNDSGTATSFARLDRNGQSAVFTSLGENPCRRAGTLINSITTIILLGIDAYADLKAAMPKFAYISDMGSSTA